MKIQPISNSSINFTATSLYLLKVKQKMGKNGFETVPAIFSELDAYDMKDLDLICDISQKWISQYSLTNYSRTICKNFVNSIKKCLPDRFFALQLDNPLLDDYSKTLALVQTTNSPYFPRTFLEISYIQSISSLLAGTQKVKVKGAGEQTIHGVVRLAKDLGTEKITIISTNDSFYEKIGIPKFSQEQNDSIYVLPESSYDEFINRAKEKYK